MPAPNRRPISARKCSTGRRLTTFNNCGPSAKPLANRRKAQARVFRRGNQRGVRGFSREKVHATAIFRVDTLEMRGFCFLYAGRSMEDQWNKYAP